MSTTERPKKTALLVAQRIVDDIHRRGNQIGDRLPPEKAMLEDYNVGRGTLRESLRFLELQGVITLKPGPSGGPIVQRPDSSAIATSLSLLLQFQQAPFETVVETRAALEPRMARLAAERMPADEIAALFAIIDLEQQNLEDENGFLTQTRRFHNSIAEGSGNFIFAALFTALSDILDGSSVGVQYPSRQRELTVDIHTSIATAISDHDPDRAEELMNTHMTALTTYTEKHYAKALAAPVKWRM
ncbi:FCD domain-containing protein [Gordonia sp. HY285]|uniref:FCD domain-containing protein n=1 Tax=Gordonia liuliyuniae TaxID=2911517 RepID=A0ABS9ITU2_9ACTN|nr:FCD domain-containing protein [Gordonia liuliyuniae]MCF8588941.1 FCD domain-containing protein [Gordonia liuliyuniae]MCF8609178.1 FCD domain-containing protein [Gordonia liuliyuniae]